MATKRKKEEAPATIPRMPNHINEGGAGKRKADEPEQTAGEPEVETERSE